MEHKPHDESDIIEHEEIEVSSEDREKKYEGLPKKKKRSKGSFVFGAIVLVSFIAFVYMQLKQEGASPAPSEQIAEEATSEPKPTGEDLTLPPLGSGVPTGEEKTPGWRNAGIRSACLKTCFKKCSAGNCTRCNSCSCVRSIRTEVFAR